MSPNHEYAESETDDSSEAITGDVIGNTAYSQRFVLKILLKFANLDSLKEAIKEDTFVEDLCTLWDMTAVGDVVDFLEEHNALSLIEFALPTVEDGRLAEIIIGILGNMCCVKYVSEAFVNKRELLALAMGYLRSSDVQILIQVLRLVNVCLYGARPEYIDKWLECFKDIDYYETLMFILQNSSNNSILMGALENMNTICSECNDEPTRSKYFEIFVKSDTVEGLFVAFTELNLRRVSRTERAWDRILAISLQIIMNLNGFETSKEIFKDQTYKVTYILKTVMQYYENCFVKEYHIDPDIVIIMESIYVITSLVDVGTGSDMEECFSKCYSMWKSCVDIERNDYPLQSYDHDLAIDFAIKLKVQIANIMCTFISKCSETKFKKCWKMIRKYFNRIALCCDSTHLKVKCYEKVNGL